MRVVLVLLMIGCCCSFSSSTARELSVKEYPGIQEALEANPNRMLFLPAGDYQISSKIRIRGERAGLFGPGRIIQNNPNEPIIELENTWECQLRDLTLTRAPGKMETGSEAILAIKCSDLVIENVRVIDNRTVSGAITLRECRNARVSQVLIRNYMRVSVDDRTASKDWGYAFNCTDGSGISLVNTVGALLEGNRIVEENLLPAPETKEKYKLGEWVNKNIKKGVLLSQEAWDKGFSENWQQGSAIVVTGPTTSEMIQILGNRIENAAQGIDLHCDRVIVANNLVVNSFIGMKAMHGSRNVLITGNQFIRSTLWAIGLMPGTASDAGDPEDPKSINTDGGSIIANNIVSDFGEGTARWVWGNKRSPFKFDRGQHADDPPLTSVVITGNLVHQTGKPQYAYAVVIEHGSPTSPRDLRFSNNLFPAGSSGVANTELNP